MVALFLKSPESQRPTHTVLFYLLKTWNHGCIAYILYYSVRSMLCYARSRL